MVEPRRVEVEYSEQPCKVALNRVKGMPFKWSLNPYMGCEHRCTFCYVRAFELRADRPYQRAEGTYRLTRGCLQVFAEFANPVGLITRGPMIVRDIDVLATLARRASLGVNFSIPTLDDEVWRRTEPGTAHPRQRLRALEKLVAAGIRAGVGMAPILPGLSDRPEQLEAVVKAARDAGAAHVWANVLYLRPGTREHFFESLAKHWPELIPRYMRLYAGRAYLGDDVTKPVQREVRRLRDAHGMGERLHAFLEPDPEPLQLSLLT